MRPGLIMFAILCGACSRGSATASLDAAPADARPDAPADAPPDAPGAYRHTIVIDGTDDFVVGEQFATTSTGYAARVTWDDEHIYIGYSGPDLDPAALDTSSKWLFAYVDVDPGTENGSPTNELYNTQGVTFPTGFRADFYARWKCDESLVSLEQYEGDPDWTTSPMVPPAARTGSFVELAIPRSAIGPSDRVGLVTWMINEKDQFEGTFAGLYAGNFADGYHASLALTTYLAIDFTAVRTPADPANAAP